MVRSSQAHSLAPDGQAPPRLSPKSARGKEETDLLARTTCLVLVDPCLHQRLQEFSRQLAVVGEFDEACTGLITGGLNLGLLGGEKLRREPNRAVFLEVLKHPQVCILCADVNGQVPFQYLSCLG